MTYDQWKTDSGYSEKSPEEENEGRDCPVCGGDCSAANPPVYHCPMRDDPILSPTGRKMTAIETKHTPSQTEKAALFFDLIQGARQNGKSWWADSQIRQIEMSVDQDKKIAALTEAIKGLIGLCQLVRNHGDLPAEARMALTHNHRIIAGYEALTAAGVEGFQPSDFDAHKAVQS